MRFHLLNARQSFSRVQVSRTEGRMTAVLRRLEQRLDDLTQRAETALHSVIRQQCDRVAELGAAVLRHDPRRQLAHATGHVADSRARLERAMERLIESSRSRLQSLDARLRTLSPLAVLERGYALVLNEQGGVVRSAAELAMGDRVKTRLAEGAFTSRVEMTETDSETKKRRRSK
jgi:exodeoxyribonuclease VII large subunit